MLEEVADFCCDFDCMQSFFYFYFLTDFRYTVVKSHFLSFHYLSLTSFIMEICEEHWFEHIMYSSICICVTITVVGYMPLGIADLLFETSYIHTHTHTWISQHHLFVSVLSLSIAIIYIFLMCHICNSCMKKKWAFIFLSVKWVSVKG